MIRSLEMTNYRGFEHYKLANLARVNLLVGKNNSGKTSILEAVQLFASRANPDVLFRIAEQRGEIINVSEKFYESRKSIIDYSGFFYGRDIHAGSKLSIRTTSDMGDITFDAEIVAAEPRGAGQGVYTNDPSPVLRLQFRAHDDVPGAKPTKRSIPLAVEADAAVYDDLLGFLAASRSRRAGPPILFITQGSLSDESMRGLWDEIVLEGREYEIVAAMRILEPRLSSIMFLSSGQRSYYSSRTGGEIMLGFEGEQRRYPLGSHGEGMRRLLALALCLTTARDGVLLIDEMDTGLHYSILGDVWLMIVETAKRFNIQVFLTTHSLDCVRALAWLCETHPALAAEVSLQKIERALKEAVAFSAEQIQTAVEQDIEVR